jgi:hypothetical protein
LLVPLLLLPLLMTMTMLLPLLLAVLVVLLLLLMVLVLLLVLLVVVMHHPRTPCRKNLARSPTVSSWFTLRSACGTSATASACLAT